ncbi:MAG: response regulator [Clostridiales bacterium]|nr:response regulator [Clostridiales bacterium]
MHSASFLSPNCRKLAKGSELKIKCSCDILYPSEGGRRMDAMKLLIADGNEEFRRALAAELQGAYHVRCCGDGKEALSLLRSFVPDVLVLDLMLPELDGISLLQSAAGAGLCPMVLVTSRFYNDYILGALGELSVGYMMRKPCDIPATAARVGDLSRHIRAPLVTPPDPQTQVTNLLLSLSIPSKLRGYAYLREAIPRMMKDPDQPITKVLYPAVGAVFGCKGTHVERSIRSAIDTAWKQRDDRVWQRYFRPGSDGVIPRPSNAAFISRLADALRLNRDDGIVEE